MCISQGQFLIIDEHRNRRGFGNVLDGYNKRFMDFDELGIRQIFVDVFQGVVGDSYEPITPL